MGLGLRGLELCPTTDNHNMPHRCAVTTEHHCGGGLLLRHHHYLCSSGLDCLRHAYRAATSTKTKHPCPADGQALAYDDILR